MGKKEKNERRNVSNESIGEEKRRPMNGDVDAPLSLFSTIGK